MSRTTRIITMLALAATALAVPALSIADPADPQHDQVIGSWEQTTTGGGPNNQFHVNARSNPDGSDAEGHVMIEVKGQNPTGFKADVTCMNVVGNTATIVARFTRATNQGNREGVILKVTDNGKTPGPPSPDMASNVRAADGQLDAAEVACEAPPLNVGTPVQGDIKVRDAL